MLLRYCLYLDVFSKQTSFLLHVSACFSLVGYDSDDDEYDDDDVRYTRRNKGKKYSQLAKDDSVERYAGYGGVGRYGENVIDHLRIDSVSQYGDSNSYTFAQDSHSDRRNSESIASSEDCGSDTDALNKQAYVQTRREGGRWLLLYPHVLAPPTTPTLLSLLPPYTLTPSLQ